MNRGFALVTGLLFLAVLSILGVTLMKVTRLETLMAGGAREAGIALQAAEAALRDAEASVIPDPSTGVCGLAIDPDESGSGRYGRNAAEPVYPSHAWTSGSDYIAISRDYPEMQSGNQPRSVIKHLDDLCVDATSDWRPCVDLGKGDYGQPDYEQLSLFRITAWGTSRDGTSNSLLQAHVSCLAR